MRLNLLSVICYLNSLSVLCLTTCSANSHVDNLYTDTSLIRNLSQTWRNLYHTRIHWNLFILLYATYYCSHRNCMWIICFVIMRFLVTFHLFLSYLLCHAQQIACFCEILVGSILGAFYRVAGLLYFDTAEPVPSNMRIRNFILTMH